MSTFLSIPATDLNDVPEPSVVRTEEECKLRVTDVKIDNNRNGEPYSLMRFSFTERNDAKTFTKYFSLPFAGMEDDRRNSSLRSLKYFYEAFGIDYSSGEVGLNELIGAEGWAFCGVEENEDSEYGPQNFIKRFIQNA